MSDFLIGVSLFFAGASASFINMMAGGGSLITLGLMMLMGIDPSIANGTNRIGVVVGTGSGAWTFKSEKISNVRESLIYGLVAIPGAIIGSYYSIQLSNIVFQKIIAVVMILVLITILLPKKKKEIIYQSKRKVFIYPGLFIIGLYGGFIQVGVGFLIMALIRHLLAMDLIKTNMHKVIIVFIYTLPVLIIFGLNGKINWMYAIMLSIGNAVGSWVSVKLAVKKGERFVRLILIIAVVIMVIRFLIPDL